MLSIGQFVGLTFISNLIQIKQHKRQTYALTFACTYTIAEQCTHISARAQTDRHKVTRARAPITTKSVHAYLTTHRTKTIYLPILSQTLHSHQLPPIQFDHPSTSKWPWQRYHLAIDQTFVNGTRDWSQLCVWIRFVINKTTHWVNMSANPSKGGEVKGEHVRCFSL